MLINHLMEVENKTQTKYLFQDPSFSDTRLRAKRGGIRLQDPNISFLSPPSKASPENPLSRDSRPGPAPSCPGTGGMDHPVPDPLRASPFFIHPCSRVLALRVGLAASALPPSPQTMGSTETGERRPSLRCPHLCPGPRAPRHRQD